MLWLTHPAKHASELKPRSPAPPQAPAPTRQPFLLPTKNYPRFPSSGQKRSPKNELQPTSDWLTRASAPQQTTTQLPLTCLAPGPGFVLPLPLHPLPRPFYSPCTKTTHLCLFASAAFSSLSFSLSPSFLLPHHSYRGCSPSTPLPAMKITFRVRTPELA